MKKLLQKLKLLICPPEKIPIWSGKCACCGEDVVSYDKIYPEGAEVEHLSCLLGFSPAGKQRDEDERQINLIKQAIKELEETPPQSNEEARNEYAQRIRRHLKN